MFFPGLEEKLDGRCSFRQALRRLSAALAPAACPLAVGNPPLGPSLALGVARLARRRPWRGWFPPTWALRRVLDVALTARLGRACVGQPSQPARAGMQFGEQCGWGLGAAASVPAFAACVPVLTSRHPQPRFLPDGKKLRGRFARRIPITTRTSRLRLIEEGNGIGREVVLELLRRGAGCGCRPKRNRPRRDHHARRPPRVTSPRRRRHHRPRRRGGTPFGRDLRARAIRNVINGAGIIHRFPALHDLACAIPPLLRGAHENRRCQIAAIGVPPERVVLLADSITEYELCAVPGQPGAEPRGRGLDERPGARAARYCDQGAPSGAPPHRHQRPEH
jgi:hypothetical protein